MNHGMLVIGLTGSIGMGKSAVADMFRRAGIAVCDADQEVHRLYAGAAVEPIEAAFPGTTYDGKVDRERLSAALMTDPKQFKKLEAIVHPLVRAEERAFLHAEKRRGAKMAVLEIPLLFEAGTSEKVDAIVVVSAPPDVQRARVMERPGMTSKKFDAILARQLPDTEKRQRATVVIDTNGPFDATEAQVVKAIAKLDRVAPAAFKAHWS